MIFTQLANSSNTLEDFKWGEAVCPIRGDSRITSMYIDWHAFLDLDTGPV